MSEGKTPFEAGEHWQCPVARTQPPAPADWNGRDGMCRGPNCAAWRWLPNSTLSPAFKKAIADRLKEMEAEAFTSGAKSFNRDLAHKKAVAWVEKNRAEIGLPTFPECGVCGLGGAPLV